MSARPVDLLAGLLADVEALEGAACAGASGAEFVDVDQADAERLVRAWCWRCPVVGRCREVGDALAPHSHPSVYGGRLFPARALVSVPALHRESA